jgi:transcriptional regulator with XRE-family HTH domain
MVVDKIKEICHDKNMTLTQLAEKIGMSNSFHTTLKNGTLRVEKLIKIAEVLGVPVTDFFEEEYLNQINKDVFDKHYKDLFDKLQSDLVKVHERNDELLEMIRSKRSILRLIYGNNKSMQERISISINSKSSIETMSIIAESLKDIENAINDIEHFEDEKNLKSLKKMQEIDRKYYQIKNADGSTTLSTDKNKPPED